MPVPAQGAAAVQGSGLRAPAARTRLPALLVLVGFVWLGAEWHAASTLQNFSLARLPADAEAGNPAQRRQLLLGGLGAAAALPAAPAFAYETYKDVNLGFTFTYPTGLQKYDNKVYNFFARDLLEPLESIGVKVTETSRNSLDEIGSAKEVGEKLMEETVPKGAPKEIISAKTTFDKAGRRLDIIEYAYQWKFDPEMAQQVGRKRFQLHSKALVAIDRARQYLVVASAEEPRWPIQGDQLGIAIDTFKLIFD